MPSAADISQCSHVTDEFEPSLVDRSDSERVVCSTRRRRVKGAKTLCGKKVTSARVDSETGRTSRSRRRPLLRRDRAMCSSAGYRLVTVLSRTGHMSTMRTCLSIIPRRRRRGARTTQSPIPGAQQAQAARPSRRSHQFRSAARIEQPPQTNAPCSSGSRGSALGAVSDTLRPREPAGRRSPDAPPPYAAVHPSIMASLRRGPGRLFWTASTAAAAAQRAHRPALRPHSPPELPRHDPRHAENGLRHRFVHVPAPIARYPTGAIPTAVHAR